MTLEYSIYKPETKEYYFCEDKVVLSANYNADDTWKETDNIERYSKDLI